MIRNNVVYGGPTLKVPAHLSLGQYVIEKFREGCHTTALINGDTGHQTSRQSLFQAIVNVATGLKTLKVKNGMVVALCSENSDEYIIAMLGAICCGATVTMLNVIYSKDEIKHVLNISQPTIIFCSEAALKLHHGVIKSMPFIKHIVQLNGKLVDNGVKPLSSVSVPADVQEYEPDEVHGSTDTAFILYSSGTTGLPKGVMLTHLNILYEITIFNMRDASEISSRELIVLPWCHVYGLLTVIECIVKNKLIVYLPKFDLKQYLDTAQKYKVETIHIVPPIVVMLAKSPLAQSYSLPSIKVVFCGGALLKADIINKALVCLPNCNGVSQGYGLTETCLAAMIDQDGKNHGSGGCPLPGIKAKVVDYKTRKKLGPYEEGEICVHGPVVMKGYMGNDAATRDIMDEEGYIKSGDVGYYNSKGYFYIVDRYKELIKYKGNQVSPAFVESIVLQHSGVAECAVVGAPDEVAGELPTAFVVVKPGVNLTELELLNFTNAQLSPIKRLHGGIIFVKEIPKNSTGKILRRNLKRTLLERTKSKL